MWVIYWSVPLSGRLGDDDDDADRDHEDDDDHSDDECGDDDDDDAMMVMTAMVMMMMVVVMAMHRDDDTVITAYYISCSKEKLYWMDWVGAVWVVLSSVYQTTHLPPTLRPQTALPWGVIRALVFADVFLPRPIPRRRPPGQMSVGGLTE